MPTILTDATFQQEVLDCPVCVLVEIGADWCGASHIMAPVLEQVALRYAPRLKVGRLDIDRNDQVPARYGVLEIPTLLFFQRGRLVGRIQGAVSRKELETQLRAMLPDFAAGP